MHQQIGILTFPVDHRPLKSIKNSPLIDKYTKTSQQTIGAISQMIKTYSATSGITKRSLGGYINVKSKQIRIRGFILDMSFRLRMHRPLWHCLKFYYI